MNKIALVLSGGGFRGAFQAGALQVIKENWDKIEPGSPPLRFDVVSGVSVGALNGLLVAQDKLDDLMGIWQDVAKNGVGEIYRSHFIDTNFDKDTEHPELKFQVSWEIIKKVFPETTRHLYMKGIFARKSFFKSLSKEFQQITALADNTPLLEKLRKYARKENFESCTYKCGFVSLNSGNFYSVGACDFKTNEDFAKGVLASTAMPIVWPPVDAIEVHDHVYHQCVDGGIRNVSPLRIVINEIKNDPVPDVYTIIIINCSTGRVHYEDFKNKNIAQITLRALNDIAITEIFNNDIREFVTKNFIVKQFNEKHPGEIVYDYDFENQKTGKPLKFFKSIVIQPDFNVLGDPLTANAKQIEARIEHGRQKAAIALNLHAKASQADKTTIV